MTTDADRTTPILHSRRFEFKYPLPRAVADRMIPRLLTYMDWDPYGLSDEGYEVRTIYMDTAGFACYDEKIDGLIDRKKIRARCYSDRPDDGGDVFLEVKRTSGGVVTKDRIAVKGGDFARFPDDPFSLMNVERYRGALLNEFLYDYAVNNKSPVVVIRYRRKPFVSKYDGRFRVTLDEDIQAAVARGVRFDGDFRDLPENPVVMEVKFRSAMPGWFHDIVERCGLIKEPFSKYCAGVERLYDLPAGV